MLCLHLECEASGLHNSWNSETISEGLKSKVFLGEAIPLDPLVGPRIAGNTPANFCLRPCHEAYLYHCCLCKVKMSDVTGKAGTHTYSHTHTHTHTHTYACMHAHAHRHTENDYHNPLVHVRRVLTTSLYSL